MESGSSSSEEDEDEDEEEDDEDEEGYEEEEEEGEEVESEAGELFTQRALCVYLWFDTVGSAPSAVVRSYVEVFEVCCIILDRILRLHSNETEIGKVRSITLWTGSCVPSRSGNGRHKAQVPQTANHRRGVVHHPSSQVTQPFLYVIAWHSLRILKAALNLLFVASIALISRLEKEGGECTIL
ncbi:unnamed protein product [Hydatigera taeniaeformis]|uniref:Uncharacterized protein n=1 Tax=Hydatigena taeniaeformis TaxID=6205 RepID=A0A3P7GMC0_HYDTA|nr:unnamed protein product [Hydatigera taeniaeformis]